MNAVPSPFAVERAMSAAQQLISQLGPDAEDQALLQDCLEGETDALQVARRIVHAALDLEAMAAVAKARAEDLKQRVQRFEDRAGQLRETAKTMMDTLGLSKLVDPQFTASLRMGPPKVLVTDEQHLGDEFFRIRKTPDLTAIGRALDAGQPVEGAVKTNGSLILSVRTK